MLEIAHIFFIDTEYSQAAKQYSSVLKLSNDLPLAALLRLIALYHAGMNAPEINKQLETELSQYPDYPQLQYAQARLLAGSTTKGDTEKARSISNKLAAKAKLPMPEYNEVMALCAASEGQFEQAAELQQQAIAGALWMGRSIERMTKDLKAYENKKQAGEVWPEDDPALSLPPPDPGPSIKNYPVSVPY